ncbi:MAG: adenylylsulfate kinase [Lachnospiraceae bacterium]|nr:adenylylsulfate kinase [Lachnospiraceae bacterium]
MKNEMLEKLRQAVAHWTVPEIPEEISLGDMPGDKVNIVDGHIKKANLIFPELLKLMEANLEGRRNEKTVIAIGGGSGVGKSGIAALLTYYFKQIGIGSYTMSGDNYPHRIPAQNDAERLRIFRIHGIRGLISGHLYSEEIKEKLCRIQKEEKDACPQLAIEEPWLEVYQRAGRNALFSYLGSNQEQNFDEVSDILSQFKNGADQLWLKRMGREETSIWYERMDVSKNGVLLLEWTHALNRCIKGVDIPVFLNSTPEETREYRLRRNRDRNADTPFISMVIEIEQKLLEGQADQAKLIISKAGERISYEEYRRLLGESG